MIILGIDPGLETVGYGIIEENGDHQTMVDFGCIKTPSKLPFAERLGMIEEDLSGLLKQYQPELIGIETLFFEKNRKTAFDVAQARGVILYTLYKQNTPIIEPTPLQVKMNITGDGRADKIQVQTMIQRILQLDYLPKPDDAADALGIALCALNMHRTNFG